MIPNVSRKSLVYGLLIGLWLAVVAWQAVEHNRVKRSARAALMNRASDISTTLGLVIRSQRRWGSIVSQERLETALKELVKSGELTSVALLNAAEDVVASAGEPIHFPTKSSASKDDDWKSSYQGRAKWDKERVTVMRVIDLGASVAQEGQTNARPTIVVPRREGGGGVDDRPGPPFSGRRPFDSRTNVADGEISQGNRSFPPRDAEGRPIIDEERRSRFDREGRPRPGRPFWMSESEYQSLLEKGGLHGFAMVMSTAAYRATCTQDLWLRLMIVCFSGVSAVAFALAWRNLSQTSDLQMRLLRTSQLNTHLKEMNIAAAGLAHETRNPLNIIRGLAQLISKETEASAEVRTKSAEIIDEVDRVTAQLTEFINYSKPREVRRAPIALHAVINDVVRALKFDIEDKAIQLTVLDEKLVVDADEKMLRQVLFNLLINAIQAVDAKGQIQILAKKTDGADEAHLEVRDNGPGVPVDQRQEIFKPYFTSTQKGTGLGLAVVQQIVLAHGWDIEVLGNEPKGAIFRLSHLSLSARS